GLDAAKVLPFLASPSPLVQRTAGWIAARRPDWGAALAGYFEQRLRRVPTSSDELARLEGQLRDLARSAAIQGVLAQAAERGGDPAVVALRVMAAAALKEVPAAWLTALTQSLAAESAPLRQQAVATARAFTLPKNPPVVLLAALSRVGRSNAEPAATRLEALSLASRSLGPVEPELFAFLTRSVLPDQPMRDRANAAETLARSALTRDQLLALTATVRSVGALELPRLLGAFDRNADDAIARRLLAAIESAVGRSAFRADTARVTFARCSPELKREAEALVATLHSDAARQNARVAEVAASLTGGDVRRGQELFNSPKAACILCHKIGYGGGLLGPDLTSIGRIRNERELLEAIMYPSATLVRGYEPVTVNLRGGGSHAGILRKDAPDEVVLATGPDSEVRIGRADIAELQQGEISLMPPGMDVIMSAAELADLVAFLKSRN
ncbi:MAG: dehydrogenase, partial [Opitutaceae bacterium]